MHFFQTIVLTTLVLSATIRPSTSQTPSPLMPTRDFSRAEPGERFSGGEATSKYKPQGRRAFNHPSGNMAFSKQLDFRLGGALFKKLWVSSPAATKSSDGLGPLYNARSCLACHLKNGRGHPPKNAQDNNVSMLFRLGVFNDSGNFIQHPIYGGQLQDFAIQGFKAEGKVEIKYSPVPIELNGGRIITLRKPSYTITSPKYGPVSSNVVISPRLAPQMIGLGLLGAIKESDLVALEDPDDKNGDGVSGRANRVRSITTNKIAIGRFNWKAGNPSVIQQSAAAFKTDIGLSTTFFRNHAGDCTSNQPNCLKAIHGAEKRTDNAEISKLMLDLVALFTANIAVPQRRGVNNPKVLAGKKLFYKTGCVSCHHPKFRTSDKKTIAKELAGQLIWPYSDLLLHDMGDGLADGYIEGQATGREWRTAPLWGIGLTKSVSGHNFYLHDGRARTLLEAILWHGGEAENARQTVIDMNDKQRENLITFLNSL